MCEDILHRIKNLLDDKPKGVTTKEISLDVSGEEYNRNVLRKLRQLHKYGFVERSPQRIKETERFESVYTLKENNTV